MIAAKERLEYAVTWRVGDFIVEDIIKEAVKLYAMPLRPSVIRVDVSRAPKNRHYKSKSNPASYTLPLF